MAGNGGFRPGAGRPKGVPNKINAQLKDMIIQALDAAGGVSYLTAQAKKNPKAFLALLGRVLPMTVQGEGGGPLVVQIVKYGDEADGDDPASE